MALRKLLLLDWADGDVLVTVNSKLRSALFCLCVLASAFPLTALLYFVVTESVSTLGTLGLLLQSATFGWLALRMRGQGTRGRDGNTS